MHLLISPIPLTDHIPRSGLMTIVIIVRQEAISLTTFSFVRSVKGYFLLEFIDKQPK